MSFELVFTEAFVKDFSRLDKPLREQVVKALKKIKEDPWRFEGLHGLNRRRKARVGVLRVVFKVEENKVRLDRVLKRDEVYKRL